MVLHACSDPESFVRGGPTLAKFLFLLLFFLEGRKDPNTTISGPFKWCFAGVPMTA